MSEDFTISQDTVNFIPILIDEFFEFIFGGGHTGSCGAFRKQYFDTIEQLEPVEQEYIVQAGLDIRDPFRNLNAVASEFLNFVNSILVAADAQFDQFKGRNLLGQTMFFSRLYGWLFRHQVSHMIFHNTDLHTVLRDRVWARINQMQSDITVLGIQVGNIAGANEELLRRVDILETILFANIEDINARLNEAFSQISALSLRLDTELAALERELRAADLANFNALLSIINSEVAILNESLINVQNDLIQQILASNAQLEAELNQAVTDLQSAIAAGDAQLAAQFNQQINGLAAQLAAEVAQLQIQINNLKVFTETELASLKSQLQQTESSLRKQIEDTFALKQREIAALQGQLNQLQQSIPGLIQQATRPLQDQINRIVEQLPGQLQEAAQAGCNCAIDVLSPVIFQHTHPKTTIFKLLNYVPPPGSEDEKQKDLLAKEMVLKALEQIVVSDVLAQANLTHPQHTSSGPE